jgi:hypothetical protein
MQFVVFVGLQFINSDMIYFICYLLVTFFMEVFHIFQELLIWVDLLLSPLLLILKIKMTTALSWHGTLNFSICSVTHSTIYWSTCKQIKAEMLH